MEKNSINNRVLVAINAVLEENKTLNKTQFATELGISPSKFTEILKGRMNAGSDIMALLASNYGINANWLLTGEGEMLSSGGESHATAGKAAPPELADRLLAMMEQKDRQLLEQATLIGQLSAQLSEARTALERLQAQQPPHTQTEAEAS